MKTQAKQLEGKRFGRLVAVRRVGSSSNRCTVWECLCDCGNTTNIGSDNLKRGNTKSCGCLKDNPKLPCEEVICKSVSKSKEYLCWRNMKRRCSEPSARCYESYGARGIKVCDRWLNSFQNFIDDMGYAPSKKHSLDRIDNDGDYEPSNCRWATAREQGANMSTTKLFNVGDEILCISEICRRLGISARSFRDRLKNGWSIDEAVSTGNMQGKKRAKTGKTK